MLVEIEAGYARNEPVTFALRKAIEKGVVDLIHSGIAKDLWAFDIEEVIVPEVKDYIDHPLHDQGVVNRHSDIVFEDDGVDMGEKVEKTYETYLEEKKLKKELEAETTEKEWEEVDKQTEENADETDNDSDSDSSGDTN